MTLLFTLIFAVVGIFIIVDKPYDSESGNISYSDEVESEPTVVPTPAPASVLQAPLSEARPSDIIELSNWKLTLPINTQHTGTPDEIEQPELKNFTLEPYFRVNEAKDGIVFRAHVGGATTKNSNYPRSELREMSDQGRKKASWSSDVGAHMMIMEQAITHLPVVKPHVVAGQVHDDSDDILMIRLEGSRLFVEADGDDIGVLDAKYELGTIFTTKIVVSGGHIRVFYNDVLKVDYSKKGSGYYFKAGCYTQSSPKKGDDSQAYGEVIIYSLVVTHQP